VNHAAEALVGEQLPRYDRVEFSVGDRVFDLSRAREELGYVTRTPLRESIRRTAAWLSDAGRAA
jgi:nucleoside-diphosphate-sugar epimerase